MRISILYIIAFLIVANNCQASTNAYSKSSAYIAKPKISISFREALWAITHPFIAPKVHKITKEALKTTKKIGEENILSDVNGGKLDAFKHAYWMALLSQEIKESKARRLGEIHEYVNYISYKRGKSNQDSLASAMDLLNNEAGINIGKNNKFTSTNQLINLVICDIKDGNMYIISKDSLGNYLDCDNKIIDLSKEKKWHKRKCLISSI